MSNLKDRSVEYPNRRRLNVVSVNADDGGNIISMDVDITRGNVNDASNRVEGVIYQAGSPLNKATLETELISKTNNNNILLANGSNIPIATLDNKISITNSSNILLANGSNISIAALKKALSGIITSSLEFSWTQMPQNFQSKSLIVNYENDYQYYAKLVLPNNYLVAYSYDITNSNNKSIITVRETESLNAVKSLIQFEFCIKLYKDSSLKDYIDKIDVSFTYFGSPTGHSD